jgi:hypothetical protein
VARRVCDLENLVNEEAIARVGLQRHVKKIGSTPPSIMEYQVLSKISHDFEPNPFFSQRHTIRIFLVLQL